MMRVLSVVASFVALNTGGFLAYRALQPEHAAATKAVPASAETISRPPETIQPKPTEMAPKEAPKPAETFSKKSTVSEATSSAEENTTPPPRQTPHRIRRSSTQAAPKAKPVESQSKENTNPPIQNSVMEMDDNPYKRGE
jgi:hypothetical protein